MSKFSLNKDSKNYLISEEVATEQVIDLLTYYDIDIDLMPTKSTKGENPQAAMERALNQLTNYVRQGLVEIGRNEDGKIIVKQNLSNGSDKVEYREVDAKAKLAMDNAESEGYGRIYAFMGSLASMPPAAIQKLPARDLAVVEILGTVFSNA